MQASDYRGGIWGHHGPAVVTRIFKDKYCREDTDEVARCDRNVTVLPHSAAYAIPYTDWRAFFDADETSLVLERLTDSFAAHYWNAMLRRQDDGVRVSADHALFRLAEVHCPQTSRKVLTPQIGEYY